MAEDDLNVPARYRARNLLRECQSLVARLLEASEALIARRGTDSSFQPQQIMAKLVERQQALRKVVDELVEHQRLNGALVELRGAVVREDVRLAQLATVLRDTETLLQDSLDEATPRLSALEKCNKRPVEVDDVIAYATKVSASLAAPPGWDPSKPLGNHLPPAPTEDMMRAGRLGALETQPPMSSGGEAAQASLPDSLKA